MIFSAIQSQGVNVMTYSEARENCNAAGRRRARSKQGASQSCRSHVEEKELVKTIATKMDDLFWNKQHKKKGKRLVIVNFDSTKKGEG